MARCRRAMVNGMALVVAVAVAASLCPAAAAPINRRGTIRVFGSVTIGPNIPRSATLGGTATVAEFDNFSGQNSSKSVSVSATLHRSGNKAAIILDLPYAWVLESAAIKLRVVFGVAANNSGAGTTVIIPLPANGALTPISLAISI
jgi:hypothetical protein